MVKNKIKSIVKRISPQFIIKSFLKLRTRILKFYIPKTKRIFERADNFPEYLEIEMLEKLQKKYPFPPEYGYDENSLLVSGKERAKQILQLPGANNCKFFLELGCWDRMVSYALSNHVKNTKAIDIKSEGFDQRAINQGVKLIQMDAAEMKFLNESFDFETFEINTRISIVF